MRSNFHKLIIYEKSFSKGNYANIIFQSQSSMRMSYHDNDLSRFCFHSSFISSSFIRHSLAINKFCMNHFLLKDTNSQRHEILKFSECLISLKMIFHANHREKPINAQHSYSFLDCLPIIYFNSYLFLFNHPQTHIHTPSC